MNGAQCIVDILQRNDINRLFGYPGGCIMPLYDALVDAELEHVLCRHEQGAALAANGYARATGELGVCIATSGPGATNLITGVADAFMDSIPMLVITGQVSNDLIGSDAFQEVDILGMTLGIVKHSYLITDIKDLYSNVTEAIALAKSGRPGPVWIDIPKDVLLSAIHADNQTAEKRLRHNYPTPDHGQLQRAIQLIREAERPVIYSGGGVIAAAAIEPFRHFANKLSIPQVVSLKGIGNPGQSHPLNLGMLGMHGSRACNEMIEQCDLLIAIGVRFDDRATGDTRHFAPAAKIIHFDIDHAEFHKNKAVDCPVHGELSQALQQLADAFSGPLPIQPWRDLCSRLKEHKGLMPAIYADPTNDIAGPDFLSLLSAMIDRNTIICCDVGQHQMWVAQYVDFDHPRQHLSSSGLGTMGFGLPAAIGATFACPEATVINVSGDGSFMMNMQELATIKRYNLPVKIIILDNQHLGLVRQQQQLFYQGRYSAVSLADNPDFADVARAFGFRSLSIHSQNQMVDAIDNLLQADGPTLLHIHINAATNVWPMVKPGGGNHEMLEAESINGSAA